MTGTDDLDKFFTAARASALEPSEALMARVLGDAYAAIPEPAAVPVVEAKQASIWRRWAKAFTAALGGGVMATGLASAAMAGVAIGYTGPVTSDWLAEALSDEPEVRVTAASDLFLGEG